VDVCARLDAEQVRQVLRLSDLATEADGVRPLSEHVSLHLRYGGEGPDRHLLRWVPDETGHRTLVGYAHVDPTDVVAGAAAELVVHPDHRGTGHGRALARAAAEIAPDSRLRLWAHGDHPAARALAGTLGFVEVRQLWQMRRSLWSPLPRAPLPDGVTLRAFRPGEDDEAWVALNARAFAGHPEQGSWDLGDLRARMSEVWFDPAGFLVAQDRAVADPNGQPAIVGFHWTKVHGADHVHPITEGDIGHTDRHGQPAGHAHEPIGEVYVVGVDPDHQGRGLGRALTVAGLRRMRGLGLPQAMLYVDADNTAALKLYQDLGFTHWDTDVMFLRPPSGPMRSAGPE
jgi:mycothiol synthase